MIDLSGKYSIILNNDSRFHLLKHFRKIDPVYLQNLLNNSSYSEKEIVERIARPGSKFEDHFAKDPDELLERINQFRVHKNAMVTGRNNRIEISYKYSKDDYPLGIGTDNIVSRSVLTAGQIKELRYEKRKNDLIGVIKLKDVITWEINVILSELNNDEAKIVTIFPGLYAPAFPSDHTAGTEGYLSSKRFWDEYVFVIV